MFNFRIGDYLLAINGFDLSKLQSSDELDDLAEHIPLGPVELVVYAGWSELSALNEHGDEIVCFTAYSSCDGVLF